MISEKNNKISFGEINKLAFPAILAGISEPLISIVDSAVVGRLGTLELGAVGLSTSFFLLLLWGLSSMKSAISSLVAYYYGKGDIEVIKTLIPQSILVSATIGIVFCGLTVPFSEEIFKLYDAKGQILNIADEYYTIRAIGLPITLSTFSIFGVFRGFQNTYWAMIISLTGAFLNCILDYGLVFGELGFPMLKVEGAAWASVISQLSMLIGAIFILKIKYNHVYAFSFKPNSKLKTLLGIGGNLFLRTIALNISYYFGNRFATSYGNQYIAAHTIAMNIWLFSSFFIDGYANAGNAIAGKIFGKGDKNMLYHTGIRLVKISILIAVILSLIYTFMYYVVVDFFTEDVKVKMAFLSVFWIVIISQPINAIAFALDGIFKGLGRAALLRNTLVIGTFIVFIPIIFGMDFFEFKLFSVWIAFLFWMIFRGGSLFIIFRNDYAKS